MSIARLKTWGTETLTATDLNAEFNNIIANALSLISPLTGDLAAGGNIITGLGLGTVSSPSLQFTGDTNTGIYSSTADTVDIAAGGVRGLRVNTATTGVNFHDFTPAAASANPTLLATGSDAAVNAAYNTKGTGVHIFSHGGAEVFRSGALTANGIMYATTNKAITSTAAVAYGQVLQGNASAVPALVSQPVYVVKAADETVNNSATLQNDDHLVFAVAANTNYFVEMFLILNAAGATSDFKFGWTFPVDCTMFWGTATAQSGLTQWTMAAAGVAPIGLLAQTDTAAAGSFNGTCGGYLWAIVRNGANAGNLQFQWSQNTITAEDNKILKDSFMRVTKLQ